MATFVVSNKKVTKLLIFTFMIRIMSTWVSNTWFIKLITSSLVKALALVRIMKDKWVYQCKFKIYCKYKLILLRKVCHRILWVMTKTL